MRHDVRFDSGGCAIAAHLYLPDAAPPHPAVVLCHGFCGVKELLLPPFAERFARAGFAALTFDYRGFGASEGEPGRLVPELQIADVRAALDFLAARTDVDAGRLALWGSSYGGANAIVVASRDDRVRCLVVQLAFGDGERVVTGAMSDDDKARFLGTLERMREKRDKTGKEMLVPLPKVLSDPQSQAFYERYHAEFPALEIKIPFLTVAETIAHKPERALDRVRAPILVVAAGNDGVNPPEESQRLFERARDPKRLVRIDGAAHYAVYEGEFFERAVAAELEWLREHL